MRRNKQKEDKGRFGLVGTNESITIEKKKKKEKVIENGKKKKK